MSNTITNGNYYYSQSAFVQSANYYSNQTFGNNDFQSAVIKKDEDSSEVVDALAKEEPAKQGYIRVVTANVWNSGIRFQAISYYGTREIGGADSATAEKPVEISDKEDDQKEIVSPIIGMSSIPVGNMSYVMTASEVFKPGSDEAIIRVHVGGKDIDVNINEVDPKNASAVEMFAYCQYADAHDTGTGYTFGSYSVLKGVTDPLGKTEYTSLDEAISKKRNWNDAISESKASFTKEQTGETFDSSVLLKMLEETANLFAFHGGDKDLGDLTDEEWEKLLADTDKAIDEAKETAIENKQQEETEAEHVKRLIAENYENGKIQKAMDGYEFIKMQGELIERNIEKLRQNQKTTRERLLEQDPNAASKWYMYGNGSKRYTFDEFCKFMDDMDAELRANAPEFKNPYFEMANYYLNKRRAWLNET